MEINRRHSRRRDKRSAADSVSSRTQNHWAPAVRHLRRVDSHLQELIDRVGPCLLKPHPDRFGALVRSIVSQQISSQAARSINKRLAALGGEPPQPERLIEIGEANLRPVGLSAAKARYVLSLAEAVVSGDVPLEHIDDTWDDEAVIEVLTSIKGIGVWTAEMFLIFALNRPDILPASDMGVRVALKDKHGLAQLPKPRDCYPLAESWRPYRSIATWYLWRAVDTPQPAPVSDSRRDELPRTPNRSSC
jgi:DNA-3-methyladenine glycosylase II